MHKKQKNLRYHSVCTMFSTVILLTLLPALARCAGEGNIRLLHEEVAAALKNCAETDNSNPQPQVQRQKRFAENAPRIDDSSKSDPNPYNHKRRNVTDMINQNTTESGYGGYKTGGVGNIDENVNSMARTAPNYPDVINANATNRTRRSEPLFNKADNDQCLSQCVFANLQVVDSRGIPREAELWNKIQSTVTSQQSRAAMKDQISACFQELQSEAEDNGCSYSNKLERCLMLRFSDRISSGEQSNGKDQRAKTTA